MTQFDVIDLIDFSNTLLQNIHGPVLACHVV